MTRRFEDKAHRDYVASFGCLICSAPAAIHHLMHFPCQFFSFIGRRDDRKSLPFCQECHQTDKFALHQMGSEAKFFLYHFGHEMYGIFKILEYCLNSPSEKVRNSLPEMVRVT